MLTYWNKAEQEVPSCDPGKKHIGKEEPGSFRRNYLQPQWARAGHLTMSFLLSPSSALIAAAAFTKQLSAGGGFQSSEQVSAADISHTPGWKTLSERDAEKWHPVGHCSATKLVAVSTAVLAGWTVFLFYFFFRLFFFNKNRNITLREAFWNLPFCPLWLTILSLVLVLFFICFNFLLHS